MTFDADAAAMRKWELVDRWENASLDATEGMDEDDIHDRDLIHGWISENVGTANPVWVSGDMCDVLVEMADTMPPEWELRYEDFAHLSSNLFISFAKEVDGNRDWYLLPVPHDNLLVWLLPEFGPPPVESTIGNFDMPHRCTGPDDELRYVAAFLFLTREPITMLYKELPSRGLRRDARRRKRPELGTTLMVTLRRLRVKRDKEDTESHIEYSHRFVVHQHWWRQWKESEQRHVLRLRGPYVKGDPDKPLIIKPRSFRWKR